MINVKIGGAVQKYKTIILWNIRNKRLIDNLQITYYDMPNNCAWNGGRINRDVELTQTIIDTYNNGGYGFCLGFTNGVIIDLGDIVGNSLLEFVSKNNPNKLHGVVLQSETLRRYIKRNYPELKLTYSITGHPTTDQLNFEGYYTELEGRYDVIVPKYSHLPQVIELLEAGKLNGSKYEILINDNCNVTCQIYKEHWDQMSYVNSTVRTPWEEIPDIAYQVEIKPKTKAVMAHEGNCMQDDVRVDLLQRFYDTGVRHFKISGRDLEEVDFEYQLPKHLNELHKVNIRNSVLG
jgi:hypothetical protein